MKLRLAALSLIAVFLAALSGLPRGTGAPAEEKCEAPPEWFPKTPKPTNQKPNPDEDCDFYKWAWQTFLYVTQPDPQWNKPRFLIFSTPEDIFPPASRPRFEVRMKGELRLTPRLAKQPEFESLAEFLQADSKGVLVDQSGRVVYYAQHMNEDFVKFIDDNKFRDVKNIGKAPSDLEFPKGCLELKSSWKILGPKDDESKFFTVKNATIAVLKLKDGKPTIDPGQTRKETVALVGLHVVGVVDGHPEFIWATFEHNDNAPNLKPGDPPGGNQPVDKDKDYTFYPKGTSAADCNKKKALEFVDQKAQTFKPSVPICRVFPFGIDDKGKPLPNLDEAIESLNKSVHESIDKRAPDLKVWNNYSLMGAVWLNNPGYFREGVDFADEDAKHPEKLILGGERALSNATMETFTQTSKINCFMCHRTTGEFLKGKQVFPPKRIGVSHILTNAYIHAQQANPGGQ